jgi:heptosyltransferase-3
VQLKTDLKIIISRTDSIGDVVLTLPMAGRIKQKFPKSKIIFLGRDYTKDIVGLSEHVDEFVSYDDILKLNVRARIEFVENLKADIFLHVFPQKTIADLAKYAKVPVRVGTTNRFYHWLTCNTRIKLSRKNSLLHEAQLNMKLLSFLDINTDLSLQQIGELYGFTKIPQANEESLSWIDRTKTNIILHPKSKGSAREWGLDNFGKLIEQLPESKFKIFISGTKEDGEAVKPLLEKYKQVNDITGKLNLKEFIAFIHAADALVAASTGPLHIAAALGKKAIGLYAPMRPIHPGRWMPIGKQAHHLVIKKECSDCRVSMDCHCIREITPKEIVNLLNQ